MTEPLFRADPYRQSAEATVIGAAEDGGIILDRAVFYPTGGGQRGDAGWLDWSGGTVRIAIAVKSGDQIALVPEAGPERPPIGAAVTQRIDWDGRYRMMRLHTALHLLSVVIALPVTGGQITPDKGRLDFDMAEAPADKAALEGALNALIAADHAVAEDWITDADLAANPALVKTMSVQPPTGSGRVRLIRIGPADRPVDLQPCGGTHVRSTGEIGPVRIGKIEKKGRQNRRIALHLVD